MHSALILFVLSTLSISVSAAPTIKHQLVRRGLSTSSTVAIALCVVGVAAISFSSWLMLKKPWKQENPFAAPKDHTYVRQQPAEAPSPESRAPEYQLSDVGGNTPQPKVQQGTVNASEIVPPVYRP